jgi:hypothetical protein
MSAFNIDSNRPSERDPAQPAFWDSYYRSNNRPWEIAGVPKQLAHHIEANVAIWRRATVLIPGCGNPHELPAIAASSKRVCAIDFSEPAVAFAKTQFSSLSGQIRHADFFVTTVKTLFADDAQIDLIYERAFLCALPHRARQAYADRMAALIAPGGLLVGYFYLHPQAASMPKGPPYAMTFAELNRLLSPHFRCELEWPGLEDHPAFSDRSRFMAWRRR